MNAIFWDFEGTLALRQGRWAVPMAEALETQAPGCGITAEMLMPLLDQGFPWRHPEVAHPELNAPDAWWAYMAGVLAAIYVRAGAPPGVARRAAADVRQVYLRLDRWAVYQDVVPALRELTGRGWRHFVLSNHVPELPDVVAGIGLAESFDDVMSSANLGYEKPHPEIFRMALERAGRPMNPWMVGDKAASDVLAAEKAGMRGVLVRGTDGRVQRACDDLEGVVALLSREAAAGGSRDSHP